MQPLGLSLAAVVSWALLLGWHTLAACAQGVKAPVSDAASADLGLRQVNPGLPAALLHVDCDALSSNWQGCLLQ